MPPSPQVWLSAAASKHAGVSPDGSGGLASCSALLVARSLRLSFPKTSGGSWLQLESACVPRRGSSPPPALLVVPSSLSPFSSRLQARGVGWGLVPLAAAEPRWRRRACWRYVGRIQSRLSSIFSQPRLPCPCPPVAFPRRSLGTAAAPVFPSLAAPRASPWRSPAACSSRGVCFGGWRKLQSACLITSG